MDNKIIAHKSELSMPILAFICTDTKFKYLLDDAGVYMANTQSGGLGNLTNYRAINEAIIELARLEDVDTKLCVNLMVNKLPPNTTVPKHRDWLKGTPLQPTLPRIRRWHLPILCNDDCYWWDEVNGNLSFEPGKWYGPMPYWLQHQVENLHPTLERINLIIDVDCSEPQGEYAP